MSQIFGDIYEAIRAERIKKGACEKDILDYVQEKAGGCLNVKNVLKTIKTLNKLVEDGVLLKKGKRYIFNAASKCPEKEEKDDDCGDEEDEKPQEDDCDDDEEEEGEEENNENDCPEEENEDEKNEEEDAGDQENACCDDKGGEEEKQEEEEEEDCDEEEEEEECEEEPEGDDNKCGDDEDDDDDDDDEDDDDFDDDDDKCGEQNEALPSKGSSRGKGKEKESKREKNGNNVCKSIDKITMNVNAGKPEKSNENEARNERHCLVTENKSQTSRDKIKADTGVIEANPEKKSRGGESIAFCVRDFIDSLYRPSHSKLDERLAKLNDVVQENMDVVENEEEGAILRDRKRKFQTKRSKTSRCKYRSRSPIKKAKANFGGNLKRDHYEAFRCRGVSSQYFQEPMEADTDMPFEKENDIEIEYEAPHHRSLFSLLPSTASRAKIEKRNSTHSVDDRNEKNPNYLENKICTSKNHGTSMITPVELPNNHGSACDFDGDEKSKKIFKRKGKFSEDKVNIHDDDEKASVCSVCEKSVKHPQMEKA